MSTIVEETRQPSQEKKQREGWSTNQLIETAKERKRRVKEQSPLLGTVIFLSVLQIFSAIVLLNQVSSYEFWHLKGGSTSIVAARFVCGIVLHFYLMSELC